MIVLLGPAVGIHYYTRDAYLTQLCILFAYSYHGIRNILFSEKPGTYIRVSRNSFLVTSIVLAYTANEKRKYFWKPTAFHLPSAAGSVLNIKSKYLILPRRGKWMRSLAKGALYSKWTCSAKLWKGEISKKPCLIGSLMKVGWKI